MLPHEPQEMSLWNALLVDLLSPEGISKRGLESFPFPEKNVIATEAKHVTWAKLIVEP